VVLLIFVDVLAVVLEFVKWVQVLSAVVVCSERERERLEHWKQEESGQT
jgi:hypothetical protein